MFHSMFQLSELVVENVTVILFKNGRLVPCPWIIKRICNIHRQILYSLKLRALFCIARGSYRSA